MSSIKMGSEVRDPLLEKLRGWEGTTRIALSDKMSLNEAELVAQTFYKAYFEGISPLQMNLETLAILKQRKPASNSNTLISLLFSVCFKDKELFNDFLVKMKGFDFFLQRLFSKSEEKQDDAEENKAHDREEKIDTDTKNDSDTEDNIDNLFEEEAKVSHIFLYHILNFYSLLSMLQ